MYRDPTKKNITPLLTTRPRPMKTLEDCYGIKYHHPNSSKFSQKSAMKSGITSTVSFKDRGDMDYVEPLNTYRHNYNKYVITSSDRFDQPLPTNRRRGVTFNQHSASTSMLKESHAEVLSKQEEYFNKTTKTTKHSKSKKRHGNGEDSFSYEEPSSPTNFNAGDISFDNEKPKKQKNERSQKNQKSVSNVNDQKDSNGSDEKDDTEEFIALIRHEIEKSVTKSITDKMNSTFMEINRRVDRQSAELKKITLLIQKLNNNLTSKISHYGEENSRHFRYLCMKSEYDKMFYQNNNPFNEKSEPIAMPTISRKGSHTSDDRATSNRPTNTILSARTLVPDSPTKPAFDNNMREMVGQLKKFCLQYESSIVFEEDVNNNNKSVSSVSDNLHTNNDYQTCNHLFADEPNFSSDGMTPRSTENELSMDRKCSSTGRFVNTSNPFNKSSLGGGDV